MTEEGSGKDLPYTNREIREKWHDIANDLHEIKLQTTMTNGSVAEINRWRERVNGGSIVAGIFMTAIVMPTLGWAIYVLVHIDDTIKESVIQTLQVYDLEIK